MLGKDPEIPSRKSKRVLIFNHDLENLNFSSNSNPQDTNNDEINDITLTRYSQNFRRDIIIGSIHAQRYKMIQLAIQTNCFIFRNNFA